MKERVREITKRKAGRSLEQVISELVCFLRGWWQYFSIIESRSNVKWVMIALPNRYFEERGLVIPWT